MFGPEAPPEEAARHNPPVAAMYLGYMGLLAVITAAAHAAVVLAWRSFSFTASRPMPELLFFPVPELLLLNVLVMPVAVNSMVLVVQGSRATLKLLGLAALLLLLAYLGTVLALLATIVTKRDVFGLRYVLIRSGTLKDRLSGVSSFMSKIADASRSLSFLPTSWRMKTLSSRQQASLEMQLAAIRAAAEAGEFSTDEQSHRLASCKCPSSTPQPESTTSAKFECGESGKPASLAAPSAAEYDANGSPSKPRVRTTAADSHGYWHKQTSELQAAEDRLKALQMVGGMSFWELLARIRAAALQGRGKGADGSNAEVRAVERQRCMASQPAGDSGQDRPASVQQLCPLLPILACGHSTLPAA